MQANSLAIPTDNPRSGYDVIVQDLASRVPPPRVVAIVRAPDGALLRITGILFHDRIEDEEHGEVYPFHTFPIESFR